MTVARIYVQMLKWALEYACGIVRKLAIPAILASFTPLKYNEEIYVYVLR